jgi:putative flippase GtrA
MTAERSARATGVRWLKFNAVGAGGMVVQLAVLAALKSGLQVDYLVATALAVEAAVVHNYFWHQRFTWVDRVAGKLLARLFKFNLTTGMVSVLGNVGVMGILVGRAHVNYFVANLVTIAVCSIANFLVSDWFVFEGP